MPLLEYRHAPVVNTDVQVTKDHAFRQQPWQMSSASHPGAVLPSWVPLAADALMHFRVQGQPQPLIVPNVPQFGANPYPASETTVAVPDAYAFTYCPICNQFGHWYSRCDLFNGSVLLFFNERDQRPYLMQHFNWMQEATLRDVFQFLRVSTGLAPRQYQLLVHGNPVPMQDRRTRCCDVGLLPGAMVRVQLASDHQFLALLPAGHLGQVRPDRTPPPAAADSARVAPSVVTAASIPYVFTPSTRSRGAEPAEPRCDATDKLNGDLVVAAEHTEILADVVVSAPTAAESSSDVPVSVHTPDMSGISVASTSLLRSVPGSSDAPHETRTPQSDCASRSGGALRLAQHSTPPSKAATEPVTSAEDSIAADDSSPLQREVDVPSVERPQDVSRWADLSVASSLGKRSRSPNHTAQASPPPQTRGPRFLYREVPSEPLVAAVSKTHQRGVPHAAGTTAHVKFLPSTMTFAAMRDMFFSVGEVLRVRVVDADASIPIEKRFSVAFVEYQHPENVDRLIATFHRARVGSFVLAVARSTNPIKGKYRTDATRNTPCSFGISPHGPDVEPATPSREGDQVACAVTDSSPERVTQTPLRAKRGAPAAEGLPTRRPRALVDENCSRRSLPAPAMELTPTLPPPPPPRRGDAAETPKCKATEKPASHFSVSPHSHAPPGGYKLAPRLGDPAVQRLTATAALQHATYPDQDCRLSLPQLPAPITTSVVDRLSAAFAAAQRGSQTHGSTGKGDSLHSDTSRAMSGNLRFGSRMANLFTLRLPELREFVKLRELVQEFVSDRVQASYFRALRFAESLRAPTANPTLKVDLLLLQCALHRCHGGKISNADAAVAARSAVAEGAACYNACALSGTTASHVQLCMTAAAALVEDIVEVTELEVMLMTALRLGGVESTLTPPDAVLVELIKKAQRSVRRYSSCDGSSDRQSGTPSGDSLRGVVAATCFALSDGVAVSETLLTMSY